MWPNTTKCTSCLFLKKFRFWQYLTEDAYQWYPIPENWSDTFGNTTLTISVFPFILLIFFTLFCSLSSNKPGRQELLVNTIKRHFHILCIKCHIKITRICTYISCLWFWQILIDQYRRSLICDCDHLILTSCSV